MYNRDYFWKPFGSERVSESQKALKSAKKYFYPTFWSFWAKLNLKKLFLIRSEILRLLVNTLTANYEYSRSNRGNLPLPVQIKLSKKPWAFSFIFFPLLEYKLNSQCSEKKKWVSSVKYFWTYWLRKMCLFKCIKAIVSENHLAVNVLTSPRNSWNLQKSTFILLFYQSETNWVSKSYFSLDMRF